MSTDHNSDDSKVSSKEERRAALLARWKEIEEEKKSIQRELSEEDSSHVVTSPIHNCPDEVLLHIFKYYLEASHHDDDKSQHPYIRRLLLICKRWNHLVIATKRLWARIEIKDGNDLFDFPTQKSLVPYINACFERSEGLLLDVELELFGLSSYGAYIAEVVNRCDERILSDADYRHIVSSIQDTEPDYCSHWYELQFKKAFDCLLGAGSDNTLPTRYRTLNITLPEDTYLSMNILQRLVVPFPHLVSLQVSLFSDDLLGAFPSLPVAERLEFDDHALHITDFNVSPERLRHLSMGVDKNLSSIRELPSFSQLQTLQLTFLFRIDSTAVPHITVELPHLHTLTLSGSYGPLLGVELHLPSLDLLIIQTPSIRSRLPKLSPRSIVWHSDQHLYATSNKADITSLAQDIITLSPRTDIIAVPKQFKDEVLTVLADYGKEHPNSALKCVILGNDTIIEV